MDEVVEIVRELVVTERQFSGPLPSPDVMRGYEELLPGTMAKIIDVFVADSNHTRQIASEALEAHRTENRRVHWMAYSLILCGYVLSAVFAMLGMEGLAATVAVGALSGTILALIHTTKRSPLEVLQAIVDRTGGRGQRVTGDDEDGDTRPGAGR